MHLYGYIRLFQQPLGFQYIMVRPVISFDHKTGRFTIEGMPLPLMRGSYLTIWPTMSASRMSVPKTISAVARSSAPCLSVETIHALP